jgi:cell division protein FtsQ
MKKLLKIIKWGMLIALTVIVLAFTEKKQGEQLVQLNQIDIEISADKFLTKNIVLQYIEIHDFHFDSVALHQFYLNDLEEILLKHPAVKKAEVYSNQQGVINIKLQQKKAIVRIKTTAADYYLDEDGSVMPFSKEYTPRAIVVSGDVNHQHHASIYAFIQIINKSEFWKSQIMQLHFSDDQVMLIPRVGNQKIHFGMLVNSTEKLANLYQFYKQAMPVKGWQTYSDISLKYNNQIVCTKK